MFKVATLAVVSIFLSGPGTVTFDGMPPKRFQGPASMLVRFVPAKDIARVCGGVPDKLARLRACRRQLVGGMPILVLPDPCPSGDAEYFARLACHEKAHLLGWKGDHPQ